MTDPCAALHAYVASQGEALRKKLQPRDIKALTWSRDCFHLSVIAPAIVYHAACAWNWRAMANGACHFPATISATISDGWPKWVQHVFWFTGWALFARVVQRADSRFGRLFSAQMSATGVIALVLFPEGHGVRTDRIHRLSATLYIADHLVLIAFLRMRRVYRLGFVTGAALFGLTTIAVNACRGGGTALCSGGAVWWWRFLEMFFEYGAMLSFIGGMVSGLSEPGAAGRVSASDPPLPAPLVPPGRPG